MSADSDWTHLWHRLLETQSGEDREVILKLLLDHPDALRHEQATLDCLNRDEPNIRSMAAKVLGEMGMPSGPREKFIGSFSKRWTALIDRLSIEEDQETLEYLILALANSQNPHLLPSILQFAHHPAAAVRSAVSCAIYRLWRSSSGPAPIQKLISLTGDDDADVVDWATFALANVAADSEEIRRALEARLNDHAIDQEEGTRIVEEARLGLSDRAAEPGSFERL